MSDELVNVKLNRLFHIILQDQGGGRPRLWASEKEGGGGTEGRGGSDLIPGAHDGPACRGGAVDHR